MTRIGNLFAPTSPSSESRRPTSTNPRRTTVAVPPPLVRRTRFNPELPAENRQAREHESFGLVIKVQAEHPTPFWREEGLSGTGFGPYQAVHWVYDNTPDGTTVGPLVGFVSDETADRLGIVSADERREQVPASLTAYFGELPSPRGRTSRATGSTRSSNMIKDIIDGQLSAA